mgnify:CR=1 FL=1
MTETINVAISAEGNDADKAVETIKKFLIGE